MKRAMVAPDQCAACKPCRVELNCPQKAIIRETAADKPWIDFYGCRGCMKCKQLCDKGAILEIVKPCNGGFSSSW